MLEENLRKQLIHLAFEARMQSYAPYSGFCVGAAVLCEDGCIYTGCNIENASYGATNCAERTAVFKAVSEGHTHLKAIAIVGGKHMEPVTDYAYPCGICRQVLNEFSNPEEMIVVVATGVSDYKEWTLSQLLPESFGAKQLDKTQNKR